MTLLQAALLTLFPILVIVAALSDVATYTIPNRLSILLVAGFIAAALLLGRPPIGIGLDVLAGLIALAAAVGMYAAGWIGGGDAKLFAAAALWLGWPAMPVFLMITALSGGGLAFVLMNARSPWLKPYFAAAPGWLGRLVTPDEAVPYGVAIAIGALAAFPHSALMTAFHGNF